MIVSGKVVHGANIGKELGFATANLDIKNNLNLKFGVYKGYIYINNQEYLGICNYGINPTCNKLDKPRLEVHIFDFYSEIYDEYITVKIDKFIRPEKQFENSEQLIKQITSDIKIVKGE